MRLANPNGGLTHKQLAWHTDMSYIQAPPAYSLLHARVTPENVPGGEDGATDYGDMLGALAEMPPELRAKIEGRFVKHSATHSSDGGLRRGFDEPEQAGEDVPGAVHPMIRQLPQGGEALYLGRRPLGYVMDMEFEESEALLDEVWAFCTQPRFQYRHNWQVGQVVCWDNRQVIHSRAEFDPGKTRTMWRTQVKGELPH